MQEERGRKKANKLNETLKGNKVSIKVGSQRTSLN